MIEDRTMEKFIDYAVFDDIGDIIGIKDNAPQAVKKAYEDYALEQRKANESGVKI